MKIPREIKETDQENTDKAYESIKKCIIDHPEIEPSLWSGGLFSIITEGYMKSGFTYEEFIDEISYMIGFYKRWWDEEKNENN